MAAMLKTLIGHQKPLVSKLMQLVQFDDCETQFELGLRKQPM